MAMTELGQFDVRFTGREASTMFLEPVFFDSDLTNEFRVMSNVVNKKKMGFVQELENIVRKYTGCGFNPVGSLSIYERDIEVEKMGVALELCWDEFEDTVFEQLLRPGVDLPNTLGTQISDILLGRVRQAIRKDVSRLVYFGNKSSVDPNNDAIDGFWTVHYPALVTADLIPRTDTGSGTAIVAGDGFDMLRAVTDQANNNLKALPSNQKKINVTGSVWQALRNDIEDGGGGDYGLLSLINGQETLTFRGITVTPQWRWDELASSVQSVTNAHYIEYTATNNKVLATDVRSPENELRSWYDDKDEKVYVKSRFKMGSNYIHPSLISVGY